jgi:valyl-tRNA synthetase
MFKLVGDAPGAKPSPTPPPEWIFDERIDQEYLEVDGRVYQRDPDTFDTWFSSGQWPVVLTEDAPQYYPLSVMETGADILRPWVARMIMLGLYINQQIPFKDVYLHGLILDEHGQKMSKSKNNVVNPMTVVDEYGSDALRLGLVMARSAGMAQAFSPDKVVAGRNFCNKLWNIARYLEQFNKKQPELTPADHWVLSKLQHLTNELDILIKDYRFAEAVETLYHTIWDDVADWYIEASKQGSACAEQVLETILKLTHPFAPFITETIWTTLRQDDSLLIGQQWSHEFNYDVKKARDFEKIRSLVVATRKTVENLNGGKQTLVYQKSKLIAENEALIKSLAGLNAIFPLEYPQGLRIPGPIAAWIAAEPAQIATYKAKLEQNLAEAVQTARKLKSRLDNASYVKNAPKHLVEETKTQLKTAENLVKALKTELEAL